MLKMNRVERIREMYFKKDLSQRQIAEELQCSRNTVRKYLVQAEPQYSTKKRREAPVWNAVEPAVKQVLDEWADKTTAKQRITGSRLHDELLARGHDVGVSTVRNIFREIKRKQAEVFIPLVHRPGDEAQVDFFDVTVDEDGKRRKAWMFVMRLMYSKRDFALLCESCDALTFADAHVKAFAHFDAVPMRIIYDNLSAAVAKIVMGGRQLNRLFKSLENHYQFEPCFCRVGRGDDKGGVEGRGKGIRLQSLTPIPAGKTLKEISQALLERVELRYSKSKAKDGRERLAVFKEERRYMRELPHQPFDARIVQMASIDKTSMATVQGARYSLPSSWARLHATVYVRVGTVEFSCQGLRLVRKRGQKGDEVVHYTDYLTELAKKPQAVRQVAPELVAELGHPFGALWLLLVDSHGPRDAGRIMAKVLKAVVDHGQDRVAKAVAEAIVARRLHIPNLGLFCPPKPVTIVVPESLRSIHVEQASAGDFNRFLPGLAVSA